MSILARRLVVSALAMAVLGACAVPAAGAGADGATAVAAKKKCKKKKGAKKKCRKGGGSSPGLPGVPLSPTGSAPPSSGGGTQPPAAAEAAVSDLTLAANPVLGGTDTTARVTINSAAPSGGQAVSLQSSSPERASVPSSVLVPAGQTTADFPISTTAGPTTAVTISASTSSGARAAQLNIVAKPSVIGVRLAYQCFPGVGLVNVGGNSVQLDVPTPNDTPVSLQSSDPTKLTVPPAVIVGSGASSAQFAVATVQATPSVTVTATLDSSSASDSARVRDGSNQAEVSSLSLDPSTVTSGSSSVATVSLDCEAGPGGATVAVSSDRLDVTVPASVVVPQDSLSTTFPVSVLQGAPMGSATITATLGQTRQATLTITDLDT